MTQPTKAALHHDGQPRYKLVSTTGYLTPFTGDRNETPSRLNPHVTWAILDRHFCHRTIATYRSEDISGYPQRSNPDRRELARRQAEAHLAQLNP